MHVVQYGRLVIGLLADLLGWEGLLRCAELIEHHMNNVIASFKPSY